MKMNPYKYEYHYLTLYQAIPFSNGCNKLCCHKSVYVNPIPTGLVNNEVEKMQLVMIELVNHKTFLQNFPICYCAQKLRCCQHFLEEFDKFVGIYQNFVVFDQKLHYINGY